METLVRKICLDSDIVISLLNRDEPTYASLQKLNATFCITAITSFEVWCGRNKPETIFDILESFQTLDFDTHTGRLAGDIFRKLKEQGNLIEMRDLFIGAICIKNNIELFTFNKKHFERLKEFGLILA